jgi:membrane fusion protein (multidrug efflux system)
MDESKTTLGKPENAGASNKFSSPLFLVAVTVALAGLFYFGLDYLADTLSHESTDDAFIAGHVVSIAPRVAGQVAAVQVLDNQMVHSNDLLVVLDEADYATTVAQKQAAALSQTANVHTIVAAYELMQAKVVTAKAAAQAAHADAEAGEATAKKAQSDLNRAEDLRKQNTISQEEFDAAQAANAKAQADWKSDVENANEQDSKVDEARKQLDTILAQKDMAAAQLQEAQTNVAAANLNLSYTKIFAPCDGRVTRKAVEAGDYLQVGQQIMSIVPETVWVVANFKESQLEKMRPGQPVIVAIDALGGKKFRAHVDSVQAGSGAAFSLLPPENATGNFVKVVQRVPVKILFDEPLPAGQTLGPGLSVTPSVQVRSFAPPAWAIAVVAVVMALVIAFVFRAIIKNSK